MKLNIILCTAFLVIGGLSTVPASAQATATPPPATGTAPAPAGHGHFSFLTPDEKAQYLKDRHQVLQSNTVLKSQADSLKAQRESMKGTNPDPVARQALHQQFKALSDSIDQAIIQLDPSAKPIVDKIVAHHQMKKSSGGATPGTPQS
jgi:hypothetical protein